MSGLLVKCTLIMRENLEELNDRGLADIPVLLGGAALTRTYVERDLREVYEGRLFYGKDAFEGLRVMDRLGEHAPRCGRRPGFGPGGRRARPAARRTDRTRTPTTPAELPARSPEVATDNAVFAPPFLGSQGRQGHRRSTTSPATSTRRRCSATSGSSGPRRPTAAETDDEFKDRIRPDPARAARPSAKAEGLLVPAGRVRATSRSTATATTSSCGPTTTARTELAAVPRSRASARRRSSASPTSSGRSTRGEADYAAFHIVTMGAAVSASATAELFADDQYQDYLLLHGLGVEMAEALAEFWHRRIREEWGFADEDGPTLAGLFRQQYRGGRYSWGYPACPDLEDNEKVAELLDAGAHRRRVSPRRPASSTSPSRPPRRIICHHPQAKYFVAR